ncbi:M20 family metallopeptidase [Turicibacter sp. TJ11]|uniref:M20 metallopeptidase family protein n=1 Tax=Turicibacter sp. TJ11 TaxID=2806443 RepID=UPI001F342ADA|nr:M20 family metallopeptidase [Turicibacter sp. TJ11]
MDFKQVVQTHRQYLHQIPELGFCEFQTSSYLKEQLEKLGYEVYSTAKTGILAYRKGVSEECIAFRSDMDGLSITEETNVDFASTIEGQMHACGHDGHMSILLGFATYVSTLSSLKKSLLFIFQPAEEGPGGAEVIVKEGILKRFNVKSIFGLHIYPEIEEGKFGLRPGAMTAQTGELDLMIEGVGGHGAMPHKSNDALIVAAQLINSYQSIISRNLNPIEAGVLTIGTINGGERRNIIAQKVELTGTIRAFSEDVYEMIKKRMNEINHGLELMFNVKVSTQLTDMYPSIMNDPSLFDLISQSKLGEHLIEIDPMMIAEDFSYYQKEVPGLFFMLGSRNEALGYTYPLHHAKFNFSERVMMDGIKLYDEVCQLLDVYEREC